MLYAALTFWLLVIVFSAWGVHWLWSGMVKPRVVNTVLLPGTLVAQLGHVLGLLITGNSVQNAALMGDDEKGAPQADSPQQQRIPVIGPVIIGLLPLLACAVWLYIAAKYWGQSVLGPLGDGAALAVPQALPTKLAEVWNLMRNCITAIENMLNAILAADLTQWRTALFLYLAVCLTVRMTPFEGNRRGAVGAIALSGLTIAILAAITKQVDAFVLSSWPILSFAVGMLLFLLLVSSLISGIVGLIKVLAKNQ